MEVVQYVLYCVVPLFVAAWLYRRRRPESYTKRLPKRSEIGYSFFTGHVGHIVSANNVTGLNVILNIEKLAVAHPESAVAIYCYGPKWLCGPLYVTKDPVHIAAVMKHKHAGRFSSLASASRSVLGAKALPSLEGADLKRHRKLLTVSILSRRALVKFTDLMTEATSNYLESLPHQTPEASLELNLTDSESIGIVTVDAVSNFSFGIDTTSLVIGIPGDQRKKLRNALFFTLGMFGERMSAAGPLLLMSNWNLSKNRKLNEARAFIRNDFILPTLKKRREDIANDVEVPDDALTCMLQAETEDGDASFSDEEMCDEAMMCLAAGQEATTTSTMWLLYQLGANPVHQQKCYEQICTVMASHPPGARATMSDLDQMPYITNFIKETQRMTPAVRESSRCLNADIEVGDYTFPAGSNVLCYGHYSSMSEEVFDNADQFIPERWENDPSGGAKKPGAVCNPFGNGFYRCFGQPMGMCAMKAAACTWLQKFKLESLEVPEPNFRVSCMPSVLRLRLKPR